MSSIRTGSCDISQAAVDAGHSATDERSNFQMLATVELNENDTQHPHNLGLVRKWLAVVTVSMGSLCVWVSHLTVRVNWSDTIIDYRACTSSIYSTTYSQLLKDFDCSHEVATLGLSLFIWGMGKVFCLPWKMSYMPDDISIQASGHWCWHLYQRWDFGQQILHGETWQIR